MSTHDGYYKQNDGLAMGSPPVPYLANVWLSVYDPVIQTNAKMNQRYMDDIITTTKSKEVNNKISEINQLHNNLKFRNRNRGSPTVFRFVHRSQREQTLYNLVFKT